MAGRVSVPSGKGREAATGIAGNAAPGPSEEIVYDERPAMDLKIQEALGRALGAYTEDIVRAPIPDKFLLLLAQLEAKERDTK